MAFFQPPPRLGNQFDDDPLAAEYLERTFAGAIPPPVTDELRHLGELGGGELYELQLRDLDNEPQLTQWDAWGHRIDRIDVTEVWHRAERLAAEHGLVATAYEGEHGAASRPLQFLKNYVVQASLDTHSCPLAMTDGAAQTLLAAGNQPLIDRAVPRLTSRDPEQMWTSGQWMTERTGGSDVGKSETTARRAGDSDAGDWQLYGTKWFTSATTSQMALALARPEGNGPGGKGLALFYLETRGADGRMNGMSVNRLKDKFGTRKLPTAEMTLDGAVARLVTAEPANGVRNIAPMLNVTRTWNAVATAWGARRGIALVKDYARRREAFGAPLWQKPLHADTVAGLVAEAEGVFHLAFRAAELLGKRETVGLSDSEELLLRVTTPLAKLTTGKQGVALASETLECFGGAGYVEDTGLPRLLADAQVLPIWEGTTNVLSLDTLRALATDGTFEALRGELEGNFAAARAAELGPAVEVGRQALFRAGEWLARAMVDRAALERGARRLAMTLGRAFELSLLSRHAQWCIDNGKSGRAAAAARRFAAHGVDCLVPPLSASGDNALLA